MENNSDFGKIGSALKHKRYMDFVDKKSRKKCLCGCETRANFMGMANGVCLIIGCEIYVRRWVRDGVNARTPN